MIRQRKLLESLEPQPQTNQTATTRVATPEEQATRLVEEQEAVEAAFLHLLDGQLDSALQLLQPHAARAQDTRTLTTLARIRSLQGEFNEAFELLGRAERLDPADAKVLYFTAELLKLRGRFGEEVLYRRRIAYAKADGPAEPYVRLIAAIAKSAPAGKEPPLAEIRLALNQITSAIDRIPELCTDVARSIFPIKPLSNEALRLYRAADPPQDGERDVSATWMSLPQWCARQAFALHRIGEFGSPGRRPMLAELHDAIVHPSFQWIPILDEGSVALSGLASSRIRLRNEDPRSPLLMAGADSALFRLPRSVSLWKEPALLIGGNGSYYHDLIEYIGRLAVAERLGLSQDVPLVVNENLAPHQLELFGLLGIAPDRLMRVGVTTPVQFRRLLVPSRLAAGGRWFDKLLPTWYRQRMQPFMHLPARATRKLYLSRSAMTRRRVDNESEVLAALAPLGFECVRPETLSVRAQIALFSEASHIVGSSGAAFTNMLFSPPRTRLVVLQNRHLVEGGGDLYFDALGKACGHLASTLSCRPVRVASSERAIDADVEVNVAQLVSQLATDNVGAP